MDISHIPSFSCVFVCTPHDSPNQIESDGDGHEHRMRFSFFMMHIIDIILLPLKCFLLSSFFCARKTTRTVFKSIILPSQKSQKVFMTTMSDSHLIKRGTKVITKKNSFYDFQFTDAERSYRSDCEETDDGISVANDGEFMNGSSSQQLTNHSSKMKNRSPLAMRQSSPFPNEMTNRRMQQYNNAQERLRNGK